MASSLPNAEETEEFRFSSDITLEDVRSSQHQFCKERNWGKFHDPRNVLLALVGEVGELAELFQWRGEVKKGLPEFSDTEKTRVGEEISDILIYLVDLAQQCHVDLPLAVHSKMQLNASKYPAKKCYGSSAKWSLYREGHNLLSTESQNRQPIDQTSSTISQPMTRVLEGSPPGLEREEGDGSE